MRCKGLLLLDNWLLEIRSNIAHKKTHAICMSFLNVNVAKYFGVVS